MSSAARIRSGAYTDADILAIYMKYRESGVGPFTREVGDFIAHSKRDRGATLETTAYLFSQVALLQAYGKNQPLEPKGKCGWWLRHYLLTKTKNANEHDIKNAANLTRKQAINAIKSWFPDKQVYATEIKCNDAQPLHDLLNLFCKVINWQNAFDITQARSELFKIFDAERIDHGEVDRFIIGTATLLNGRSMEIVSGFKATVDLCIRNARHIPVVHDDNSSGLKYITMLPDGDLTIQITTQNTRDDGLFPVAFDFLLTGIDTERFFSRSLVELDEHKMARLRLSGPFSFDTTQQFPVNHVH